ncbi:MAG: hypothetical protein Q4B54_08660 [Coriobacteriales bacterium]|nr:hypothetical protein [Coriobacteriales bacterium]
MVTRHLERVRPDYISVVELALPNDANQFADISGEDVWSMFFKPLSPYSLEEVYDSEHVVLDLRKRALTMCILPRKTPTSTSVLLLASLPTKSFAWNYSKLFWQIYAEQGSDSYGCTLTYLANLEGIIRCNPLVTNVSCGAVTYSLGWDPAYEFMDVPKIMPSL